MAKQPNKGAAVVAPEEKKKPEWMTKLITSWNEQTKKFDFVPLELSVTEVRDNWNFIDYCVSREMYEEDSQGLKSMMKKLGYYLIQQDKQGFTFQHYTRKIKPT